MRSGPPGYMDIMSLDEWYPTTPEAPPGYQAWDPRGTETDRLAGWWLRVGATLLDEILFVVVFVLLLPLANLGSAILGAAMVQAIYATGMIGTRGQTVGMMATGTMAVDATTGELCGPVRGFVRWLVSFALRVVVVGQLVDVLWPLGDGRNQTVHDKAARTIVVRGLRG